MDDFISLEHMVKVYPPRVLAVDNVSVGFQKGEIHSIVGENGAGKSTLMKLLYGLVPFDSGVVKINGAAVHFRKPGDAIAMGIGMVHQEIELISQYTVWENVVLGAEPVRGGIGGTLDSARAIELVRRKIDEFQFNLDPSAQVERISVAALQKVEILKLLYRNVSVLILDEPTRGIDVGAKYEIYILMNRLVQQGMSIMMISSELSEILGMSDRVYIVSSGKISGELPIEEATQEKIMQLATN